MLNLYSQIQALPNARRTLPVQFSGKEKCNCHCQASETTIERCSPVATKNANRQNCGETGLRCKLINWGDAGVQCGLSKSGPRQVFLLIGKAAGGCYMSRGSRGHAKELLTGSDADITVGLVEAEAIAKNRPWPQG